MTEEHDGFEDFEDVDEKENKSAGKPVMRYILIFGAVLIAVLAAYALYTQFTDVPATPEQQADNDIKRFASYDELANYVKDSASSGYGLYGAPVPMAGEMMAARADMDESGSSARKSSVSGTSDFSKTNIQVEGVDEADIVKSDGKFIYTVSSSKIFIVKAYPAESAEIVSLVDFNGTIHEIFVNDDKLVIFGQKYEVYVEAKPMPGEEKMAAVESEMMYPRYFSPKTSIAIYDVSDREAPALVNEISIDGDYHDSRMIGQYVYAIVNQPTYYVTDENVLLPEILLDGKCAGARCLSSTFPDVFYFDGVSGNVFTTIAAINLDRPEDVSSKILLTNYAQNMYVSSNNIYITYTKWQSDADYVDRMVDVIMPLVPADVQKKIQDAMALDVSKMTKMQAVSDIMERYSATLSDDERLDLEERGQEKMAELEAEIVREREKTIVQKIAIDDGTIEYMANGAVPGNTLNQFSMDEYNGYFRIATTTSGGGGMIAVGTRMAVARVEAASGAVMVSEVESVAPSSEGEGITQEEQRMIDEKSVITRPPVPPRVSESKNHVYVLDDELEIAGRLEDLASGERIYSVRFMGDKAYMVTFRQMDPLFVIDLSVPESPKVLGYLKIPGVSDYLHPYDESHVIGVGRDATDEGRMEGMKLSLFDVSDVSNPKENSKYIIGDQGTSSDALYDHKAFMFSREKSLLVIPVSEYNYEPSRTDEMGGKSSYWQGAYVFNVDLEDGIVLKGKIEHEMQGQEDEKGEMYYYYDYASQIRRSLYIDDVLYTVSQRMIKMNGIANLDEINKVEIPFEAPEYNRGIVY
ncbi:MAG: beta-propeller domain-containing protein [archaeon]